MNSPEILNSNDKPPKTLAVVLNWNGLEMTAKCCASLAAQTFPGLSVIAVDNGSDKNTPDELAAACPGAVVVASPENLGFAGGVNFGIRQAVKSGVKFDFVWLVNNDAVCGPDTLSLLIAAISADERTGAAGCNMIQHDAMQDSGNTIFNAGMKMLPPFYIPLPAADQSEMSYLCGACLLIRMKALEKTGMLDEGFFFFFEDADWCLRAKNGGWKLTVAGDTAVIHTGSATIGRLNYKKELMYRRGYIRFLKKHSKHPIPAAITVTAYRILVYLFTFNFAGVRAAINALSSLNSKTMPEK